MLLYIMKNICDWNNCNEIGEYKAPVEKDNSRKFRMLCLEHVKEFNKNWNYFAGMSDQQIIEFMKSDMIWHKPTQSFSSSDNFFKILWNNALKDETQKIKNFEGPIIAITGSYSKTTTKNILAQILSQKNKTFATPESFNNRLGIAKAINENLKNNDEISIIEMGTYGFGEIREMCSWVRPHISVITGIAPVHLERMKTLDNILDAKSEIVDLTGSVVINGDDSLLLNQARLWTAQKMVIDCSTTSERAAVFVDYKNNVHSVYIGGEFIGNIEGPKILQLSISLSVGVMVALELDVKSYLDNLGELEKTDHRQTILQGSMGQTIIDNSFNSNPISCISSLETLEDLSTEGKKYLITPGMVELGSEQFSYNYEFAHFASEIIDEALIVGFTNKGPLMLAFEENNIPVKYFKNRDLAVSYLNSVVNENDIVLFENDLPDHHP